VGKTANSQVAVFGCLSNSKHASIVDCRLYLPESWTTDSERCDQAGIPPTERAFKTKLQLGIDIIKHQMSLGINFDYVGGDGFYGHDASFAREIGNMGLLYVLDIHSNHQIFLEKPELLLPERKSSKGRSPKRFKVNMEPINANNYIGSLSPKDWEPFAIRLSAKGVLEGQFHFKKVFILDKSTNTIETRLLIVSRRKTANGEEYKYSFTNASLEQFTQQALVCMQAQRFFIEHSFKEQKQILGMDQFQTRKWKSFYHQIALNMMVGCFMLKEKLLNREDIPILSARDVMDFLVFKFHKEMTEERILANLKERHRKRQKDINYCYSSNFNVSK